MTAKVSVELLKQVEEAEVKEPQREIPVIVNVAAGADPVTLEQKGMVIKHVFPSISAIAGTLNAAQIREIVRMDQVQSIEYDGTMRAL